MDVVIMMSKEELKSLKKEMDSRRKALLFLKPKDEPAVTCQDAVIKYGEEAAKHMELLCVWYMGRYLSMEEWKDVSDITPSTIRKRLKAGWSFEEAVNTEGNKVTPPALKVPTAQGGRPAARYKLASTGQEMTLSEWAKK